MNEEPTYYTDLITKYFAGEANEEEIVRLSDWLSRSKEHQQWFDEYRRAWLAVEEVRVAEKLDTDAEFEILKTNIESEEEVFRSEYTLQPPEAKPAANLMLRYGRIAAVMLLLIVSGFLLYFFVLSQSEMRLTAEGKNLESILPDSTVLTLAKGSTLICPASFNDEVRKVKLHGEAFFEVKPDAEKPFIILTEGDICIEVLGTSFYVNSRSDSDNVEVILTSGKVAVYYSSKPDERTIMTPGDKVLVSKTQTLIAKTENNEPNYLAWKTGKLVFEETRLDKIVTLLNKVYQADVRLADPELGECTLTATFDKQSLNSVLNVIRETLSLNITKKENTVIISGNGCL